MKGKFINSLEKYDGSQLTSLRNYLKHGLLGDSIVAWIAPCDVTFEHMVDGEDLLVEARISAHEMLHFVVEKFEITLFGAVALQRLLACIVREELGNLAQNKDVVRNLVRKGDDLYYGSKKLSISVATQSPTSSLIHFGINITNEGTPVETLSLAELEVNPTPLAKAILTSFCTECESIREATQKVRWVR